MIYLQQFNFKIEYKVNKKNAIYGLPIEIIFELQNY